MGRGEQWLAERSTSLKKRILRSLIPEPVERFRIRSTLPCPIGAGIVDLKVTLGNLTHTFPDDLDFLFVGQGGANLEFWSDAGSSNAISNGDFISSDSAALMLPNDAAIASGTYRPGGKSENILSWIAETHLRFAEASKLSGTLMPMAARLPYYTAPEGWHLGLTIPGGFHAGKSASDPPM
jgi:hypothetical protein